MVLQDQGGSKVRVLETDLAVTATLELPSYLNKAREPKFLHFYSVNNTTKELSSIPVRIRDSTKHFLPQAPTLELVNFLSEGLIPSFRKGSSGF